MAIVDDNDRNRKLFCDGRKRRAMLDSGRCRRFGAAIDGYGPEEHFWSTM